MKKTLFAFLAAAVGAAGLATVDAAHARGDVVTMKEAVTPGTIIVRTQERRLYYVTGAGQAISYQVGKSQIMHFLADARLAQGDKFSLRAFHDFLWLNGNVPIALQRWEYLGKDDDIRGIDGIKDGDKDGNNNGGK